MATVLVVDDYPDACQMLARLLKAMGHTADVALDGEAALEYVRAAPPAVVFLDVMMPGLDGYGVLAALRADPATAAVPVVMYTAHGSPDARARAMALGADDCLVKGVATLEDIERAVDRLTRN